MARESLPRGPEKPFHEDVKVKPALPWRLQDVGDGRAMGNSKESYRWRGPARETRVRVSSTGRKGDLKSPQALASDM